MRLALLLALPLAALLGAAQAPGKDLWDRWTRHDPASTRTLDHSAWGDFLARYVVRDGDLNRVRYGAVSRQDAQALQAYIDGLASTDVDALSRPVQKAYWINLYNALTVDLILDHYPVDSIRDIKSGLFDFGPWNDKVVTVNGVALTLDDIEHRILRPIWDDPLIHYGVNCAAVGCPNLLPEPYTGERADAMLAANGADYVNGSRAVLAIEGDAARVSSIYVWYKSDFGGGDAGVLEHLRGLARPPLAARLAPVREIGGHDYDWSLNEASGP